MFKLICDNREKKVLGFLKKELDKKNTYSLIKDHCLQVSEASLETDFEIRVGNEIACSCIISRLDEEYSHPFILYEDDQLKVGDYIITQGNNKYPLAVIERKTLPDFSSSIKDGRHHNYEKLLKLRELTGCKIFYFIEGSIDDLKYSSSIAGIKFSNIFSSFLSLQIKYDIHIIYTKNEVDTARKLKFLAEKMAQLFIKGELKLKTEDNISFGDCMNKSDFTEEEKMKKNVWGMWEAIPQIGRETAKKLSSEFCIRDYIMGTLDESKFSAIGLKPKQISNVKKQPNTNQSINILANIPGISKVKANKILNEVSIEELIQICFSPSFQSVQTGNIHVEKKKKLPGVGKKTIEVISKYLTIVLKESEQVVNNSNVENVVSNDIV